MPTPKDDASIEPGDISRVTLADMAAEVSRELALRRKVYAARVRSKQMRPESARLHLTRMAAIGALVERMQASHR